MFICTTEVGKSAWLSGSQPHWTWEIAGEFKTTKKAQILRTHSRSNTPNFRDVEPRHQTRLIGQFYWQLWLTALGRFKWVKASSLWKKGPETKLVEGLPPQPGGISARRSGGQRQGTALRCLSTGLVIDILAHVSLETPCMSQTLRLKAMSLERRGSPTSRPF